MKGNCCPALARSVDLMVTTAGETRLTRSAYEVCTLAARATGAVAADWPLIAAKEKTTRTRLKNKFVRETAPLYIFMSFIRQSPLGGCIRYGFKIQNSPVRFTDALSLRLCGLARKP